MTNKNFRARALSGEFSDLDIAIDGAISEWHKKETKTDLELHQWLGLSKKEYTDFVELKRNIYEILKVPQTKQRIDDAKLGKAVRELSNSYPGLRMCIERCGNNTWDILVWNTGIYISSGRPRKQLIDAIGNFKKAKPKKNKKQ